MEYLYRLCSVSFFQHLKRFGAAARVVWMSVYGHLKRDGSARHSDGQETIRMENCETRTLVMHLCHEKQHDMCTWTMRGDRLLSQYDGGRNAVLEYALFLNGNRARQPRP
jgi:hypothetical protein